MQRYLAYRLVQSLITLVAISVIVFGLSRLSGNPVDALLPDDAIVVNTARGAIVDDAALIEALKSGKLAAAGIDTFNNEPDIEQAYWGLTNTFLLPHIGSATRETRDAMGFRALDNMDAIFAGREPGDRVA